MRGQKKKKGERDSGGKVQYNSSRTERTVRLLILSVSKNYSRKKIQRTTSTEAMENVIKEERIIISSRIALQKVPRMYLQSCNTTLSITTSTAALSCGQKGPRTPSPLKKHSVLAG